MDILLAGMNYMPNQFSRAIESLGCRVIHTSGDPGPFQKWCRAAVLAKCQLSHQKFWDVKEEYRRQNKPIFIGENFSTIRAEFEAFVKSNQTTMAKAFDEAKVNKQRTIKEEIIIMPPKPEMLMTPYAPGVKTKILKMVEDCRHAGMNAGETCKYLKAEGMKKADGVSDFNKFDVYGFRSQNIKSGIAKRAYPIKEHTTTPEKETKKIATPRDVNTQSNEITLYNKILDLGIDAENTVQFQNWVRQGRLDFEQAMWMLNVLERINPKGKKA